MNVIFREMGRLYRIQGCYMGYRDIIEDIGI